MPGSAATSLGTGATALTRMLNQPIPGLDSGGFDTLSEGYDSAQTTGIADLSRRGLTTTGAAPEMEYNLQNQYRQGASQVVQQGVQQTQQQRLAILNAMLGLGSAGLLGSKASMGSEFENMGYGSDVLQGILGPAAPPGGNSFMSAPNLRSLLSGVF
jgi:hypothetical protein